VPLDAVYRGREFQETQLTHVRNGQPVEIEIDSFTAPGCAAMSTACRRPADWNSRCCGQRHRQFHQDRAARAGEDRAGRPAPEGPAPRHVTVPTVNTKATVLAERETQARLASDTALTRPTGGACRPLSILTGQSFHASQDYRNKPP
jgi:membrane fusion protein (multidrug efflux system)